MIFRKFSKFTKPKYLKSIGHAVSIPNRPITSRAGQNIYKWSYVAGDSKWPLNGLTIGQLVDRAHDLYGDREAIVSVHQGRRFTFTQLKDECEKLASGLIALGLEPGDRLGIWGPNTYEWIIAQFAAAKAGLILVNINQSYLANELEYCLNKVGVKALISDVSFKTSEFYKLLEEVAPELHVSSPGQLKSHRLPHLKTVIMMSEQTFPGTYKYNDVLTAADSTHVNKVAKLTEMIQFDEACNIQFTSGTTGNPKGAILSHHNVVNNAYGIGYRMKYAEKAHRICLSVPLYHCFGCVAGTLTAAWFGATVVLPASSFDAKDVVASFETERISSCYGTPTMFVDILKEGRTHPTMNLSSLSTGIMAGASCPQELVKAMINILNMKEFLVMYGMTETSPVTFQCYTDDPIHIRSSTIGFPSNNTEVKVVNERGNVVPTGKSGQLLVRGYCIFLGYWGDEEKTRESMSQGHWFKTGDLAIIQPNGYGQIIGRIKDVIIRGGENIYPAEVENFLMTHPDVIEAQVFGIPNSRLGEEVAVWVRCCEESKLTDVLLRAWCKEKIAYYKIPKHVIFRDHFPRTVTGKIQKFIMRDTTVQLLNTVRTN